MENFKKKINLALAEDNLFLRESIARNIRLFDDLNLKVIAKNGEDLIKQIHKNTNVDIILMDIEMPVKDGIEATKAIKKLYPQIKIVMITVFDDEKNIYYALKAGADGYLLKDISPEILHKSIVNAYRNQLSFSEEIVLKSIDLLRKADLSNFAAQSPEIQLTKREQEVLTHLSQGLSYMHISQNLYISEGTVRKHIENIYKKLGVHNKVEAIQKAKEYRLI